MAIYVYPNGVETPIKNMYIGDVREVWEYTISNIPTDDSNVYVNVTRSWKTIQSVKFNLTCSYIQNRNAFVFISSNASNTNRYWFTFRWDTTTVYEYTWSWIYIRWRLNNSSDESIFRKIPNWFSTSSPNVIEYTINKDWNCSLTCNWQTTSFTATSSELTMLQTIINSSTMNVYSSQSWSIISWNKVDVIVTYS